MYSTTDKMVTRFEVFPNQKPYILYLNEIMRTKGLQVLTKYWDIGNTPYSTSFDF